MALDVYMECLAEAQDRGLTRHIGVSNFTISHLQRVDKLMGLINKIAAKHDASAAQVTIAWLLQQGFAVIPSSTKREHLESNWAARNLRLSADDIEMIEQLDRGERIANPDIAPHRD